MLTEELKKLETLGPVGIKVRSELKLLYDDLDKRSSGTLKPGVIRMIDKHKMDFDMFVQLSYSMIATGTSEGQKLTALAIAIAIGNQTCTL